MKALVCWNACDESEKQKLENTLLSILKKEGDTLELDFVFSESEFKQNKASIKKYNAIIVLSELTWNNRPYSRLHGIDLVQKEIRLQGVNLPVLFLSFLSREQILKHDNSKQIISTYALGNHFIQLPMASKEDINRFKSMLPVPHEEMEDTLNFILPDKIVSTIRHDVKASNLDESKERLLNVIHKFTKNIADKEGFIAKIEDCETTADIRNICNELEPTLRGESTETRSINNELKYKVLLLEDEKNEEIDALINEAKIAGLTITHCRKTSEAYKRIKEDTSNDYSVIVVDFRIWDDPYASVEYKTMTEKQGYRFIEDVVKLGRRYTFVSFSELPRAFRLRIASISPTQIIPEDKRLALDSDKQRKAFINKLIYWVEDSLHYEAETASKDPVFIALYNYEKQNKSTAKIDVDEESNNLIKAFETVFENVENLFNSENLFKTKTANTMSEFKQEWKSALPSDNEIIYKWINTVYFNADSWKAKNDIHSRKKTIRENIKYTDRALVESFLETINNWHNSRTTALDQDNPSTWPQFSTEQKSAIIAKQIGSKRSTIFDLERDVETFRYKLVIRRLAIYIYYWLNKNKDNILKIMEITIGKSPFGYINCVNAILTNWHLEKDVCYPSSDKTAPKTTQNCLWISNPKGPRISRFSEIGMTHEERNFFKSYYPVLYDDWVNK